MSELRFLRLPEVQQRTGLKRSTIYIKLAAGTFPKPVKLGERGIGWVSKEIDQWIAERIAKRDARE